MSGATMALMAAPGMIARLSTTSDTESGAPDNNVFSPVNTVGVDGGSGTYSYLWSTLPPINGTWGFGTATASSTTVEVTGVPSLDTAFVTVVCTVTDTIAGTVVVSNKANYVYHRTT
jgi:hypothetical protein